MKKFRLQIFLALFSGFVLTLAVFGIAKAADYTWNTYNATFYYDSTWPLSPTAWQTRVDNARSAWNNVTPTTFSWTFNSGATSRVEYKYLCCGRLGETGYNWCGVPFLSDICAAFPRINNTGYTWYINTGTPPAGQFDLWSVLTHEFGHASGLWDHSTWGTCTGSAGPTMCPSISATKTHWRTLEYDDKNRFNLLYP